MTPNATMKTTESRRKNAGFTLVEALVAIVILAVGLMAISNLLLVAGTSNAVASRSSAAAALATQQLERLKAIEFTALAAGGDLDADVGVPNVGCNTANGTYNCWDDVDGVGRINVRWLITPVAAANTFFIAVRAESTLPFMGARTRAEFTTFRVRS